MGKWGRAVRILSFTTFGHMASTPVYVFFVGALALGPTALDTAKGNSNLSTRSNPPKR